MATFKAEVYKHQKRADGTWNVKIRLTHNRQKKYLSTPIYVKADDITRSFKLKKNITDKTDKMIDKYEEICANLGLKLKGMTIDQLVTELERECKSQNITIDFFKFSEEYIQDIITKGREGTAKNYRCALKSLKKFIKRDSLDFSEINFNFLSDYSKTLIQKKEEENKIKIKNGNRITTNRALSLYLSCIRHLYNEAKSKYNDEENGKILIPWSPFTKFKIPKEEPTRKRALPSKLIWEIYNLPYILRKNTRKVVEQNCRYNLAKDIFLLSFGLIGMNSADLFSCTQLEGDTITYQREKTKSRREDKAEISVVVQDHIKELFEKYRDKTGKRVFKFYQMYNDKNTFNQAINKGLKEIGKKLKIEDLELYAARHSWATIALNEVGIDKYTVHEALNHVDNTMRVTDIYITKDFSGINKANLKVLEHVFKKK